MTAIQIVTPADIAIKCIRTLWAIRHSDEARRVIRKHVSLIRLHRSCKASLSVHRAGEAKAGLFPMAGISAVGN